MILAALGTHPQPMSRLVAPLRSLAASHPELGPFVIQHGSTELPSGWSGAPWFSPERMRDAVGAATIAITHGGPATIALARSHGLIPIAVPRRAAFGEHVDDHQLWYCRRLAEVGDVLLAEDAAVVPELASEYPHRVALLPPPMTINPTDAIRAFQRLAEELLVRTDGR